MYPLAAGRPWQNAIIIIPIVDEIRLCATSASSASSAFKKLWREIVRDVERKGVLWTSARRRR